MCHNIFLQQAPFDFLLPTGAAYSLPLASILQGYSITKFVIFDSVHEWWTETKLVGLGCCFFTVQYRFLSVFDHRIPCFALKWVHRVRLSPFRYALSLDWSILLVSPQKRMNFDHPSLQIRDHRLNCLSLRYQGISRSLLKGKTVKNLVSLCLSYSVFAYVIHGKTRWTRSIVSFHTINHCFLSNTKFNKIKE